jgi:hypothetical protein
MKSTYTPNPWTRHYQIGWENRSANPALPLWARVVALAYGRHEANGHANFGRGQLSWIMGTPPKDGGEHKRRDRKTLRDAIATAVKYGWLAEGSCSECLVVPGHDIVGPHGDPFKPCPVHERRAKAKVPTRPTLRLVAGG